jgi:hypothetical protein
MVLVPIDRLTASKGRSGGERGGGKPRETCVSVGILGGAQPPLHVLHGWRSRYRGRPIARHSQIEGTLPGLGHAGDFT